LRLSYRLIVRAMPECRIVGSEKRGVKALFHATTQRVIALSRLDETPSEMILAFLRSAANKRRSTRLTPLQMGPSSFPLLAHHAMRTTLSLLCLLALLALATPAQAQLRADLSRPAPAAVYDNDADADADFGQRLEQWMGTLFSDDHFRMTHSYELSMSSFGGGQSLGMYTNTMQWQFNDAWAARADVSVVHQPFGGGGAAGFGQDGQNMRVMLRNAEVAYRPNENMEFRFQVRNSPYGGYARPVGAYGSGARGMRLGRRSAFSRPAPGGGNLFWKQSQRN
jgi:hypothetical protein